MRSFGVRSGTIAAALLVAILLTTGSALAHANLVGADPNPNSRVDEAPDRLHLSFSEPLEDAYTRVQVVGPNGSDHAQSFTIEEPDRRSVSVELDDVADGVYSVRWRTLSAADGHTRAGSYLLAVNASLIGGEGASNQGAPTAGSAGTADESAQIGEGGPGEAVLRGLGFLGASLAAGIPLFQLAARGLEVPSEVRRRWWGAAVAGAGTASAAVLGVAGALAVRTELPFSAALATTPGQNLAIRAGLFAAAGLLLLAGARWRESEYGPALTATGALAALAGLLVTSLGSHAAADGTGAGLSIAVDWVHQAAVAFWIGGVAALAIAGLSALPVKAAAGLIRRFSPLAVASVVLIVLTGIVASVDRLTSPADLVSSLYGFALSAKILLLLPLLALGAYHRYWLVPQLEEPGHASQEVGRLRNSAALELGLMVVVLLAAGLLTTTSPPTPPEDRAPYATFDQAMQADVPGPFSPAVEDSRLGTLEASQAANVTLRLLQPARIDQLSQGDQPVWLLLTDETGKRATPVTDADVQIQAWMPAHGHGTQPEMHPVHVHEGMYEGATHWMMPGAWELRFDVTLPEGDVLHYNLTVYVEQKADPLDQRDPIHTASDGEFDFDVYVAPQPVTVGAQNVTVQVAPDLGFPENASVLLNAKPPSDPYGEGETYELDRWLEDTWTREGPTFTEAGTWRLLVALQGKGAYASTSFELEVQRR